MPCCLGFSVSRVDTVEFLIKCGSTENLGLCNARNYTALSTRTTFSEPPRKISALFCQECLGCNQKLKDTHSQPLSPLSYASFTPLCPQVTSFDSPLLKSSCARLANGMVAVLGPELTLGSSAYTAAKVVISDADTLPTSAQDEESTTTTAGAPSPSAVNGTTSTSTTTVTTASNSVLGGAAELEAVLFVQQLVLFAPHAVPPAKHVAMLTCTLRSPSLALRRAAAATLRHLAERSPRDVGAMGVERMLVGAMDAENDGAVEGECLRLSEA